MPVRVRAIRILGVRDGSTWTDDQLDLSRGDVLAIWVGGLPENVDRANLAATVGGERASVEHIGADQGGIRQINVRAPASIPSGPAQVLLAIGDSARDTAELSIVRTAN
jgi:uncharacterized protein (TIGR03437 family)